MTVIALQNVENDPHVIAHTLLSAKGLGPRADQTVRMPSAGQVSSAMHTHADPFYVVRLAHRTIFPPSYAGVLAFAGHCNTVFEFWKELTAHILTLGAYQPKLRVDRELIERALKHTGHRELFSLLGLIKGANGQWEAFTHNEHTVMQTENFGTCYLAGSDTELLLSKIRRQQPVKLGVLQRIDPTENLAEGFSGDLLYAETDAMKGMDRGSTFACGGFYECYRVFDKGVRTSPARLDIYVVDDRRPLITRRYLVESLQQERVLADPLPATTYSVMVMNVVIDATVPELRDGSANGDGLGRSRTDTARTTPLWTSVQEASGSKLSGRPIGDPNSPVLGRLGRLAALARSRGRQRRKSCSSDTRMLGRHRAKLNKCEGGSAARHQTQRHHCERLSLSDVCRHQVTLQLA